MKHLEHIIEHMETTAKAFSTERNPEKAVLHDFALTLAELSIGMNSADLLNWNDICAIADKLLARSREV